MDKKEKTVKEKADKPKRIMLPRLEERVIIEGIHADNTAPMEERKHYIFWASVKLMEQYPIEGDIVRVCTAKGQKMLIVTNVRKYEAGADQPTRVAMQLYHGARYNNLDIESFIETII